MRKISLTKEAQIILEDLKEERNRVCMNISYKTSFNAITFAIKTIEELLKIEMEINNCYDIAKSNLESGLLNDYHKWMGRVEAFRDVKAILEEKLSSIAPIKQWVETIVS